MGDKSKQILDNVRQFIDRHGLFRVQEPMIFVGLSGGSDSVALLHILLSLGYKNIIATHCNFQLRGEESERDQKFCQGLCKKLGVKLLQRRFNTPHYMEDHHLSLEMACRELRYNWWEELIRGEGRRVKGEDSHSAKSPLPSPLSLHSYIAVGHHLDDSVETILMNLMRGTGISGLTGIVPFNQQTRVVRPLLCLSRKDILDYVSENNLDFVTDSTNRENDTQRNAIRNRLLPLMEEINPNARRGIIKTMQNLQDIEAIANNEISQKLDEHVFIETRNGRKIPHLMTRDMDVNRQDFPVLVRAFLLSAGINLHPNTLTQVTEAARTGERKIFQGDSYWLCNSETDLIASTEPISLDDEEYIIKGIEFLPKNDVLLDFNIFETSPHRIASLKCEPTMTLIDIDKISLPLKIRHWREGDRIVPFGRTQSKLVSDLMTDAHFSHWQKLTNWIVEDATGEILWVYGLKSSDKARIDSNTKRVVAIIGPE